MQYMLFCWVLPFTCPRHQHCSASYRHDRNLHATRLQEGASDDGYLQKNSHTTIIRAVLRITVFFIRIIVLVILLRYIKPLQREWVI